MAYQMTAPGRSATVSPAHWDRRIAPTGRIGGRSLVDPLLPVANGSKWGRRFWCNRGRPVDCRRSIYEVLNDEADSA